MSFKVKILGCWPLKKNLLKSKIFKWLPFTARIFLRVNLRGKRRAGIFVSAPAIILQRMGWSESDSNIRATKRTDFF